MVDPMDNSNEDDLSLPAAMQAQLREVYSQQPVRTDWSRTDAKVLGAAAEHFAVAPVVVPGDAPAVIGRIGWSRWHTAIAAGFAAAAMLALVIWINQAFVQQDANPNLANHHASPRSAPVPGDVNGDGDVNILDAYLLQRRIETAATMESQWDLTHDGQVDRSDVNAIAAQSVKLDGGPRL